MNDITTPNKKEDFNQKSVCLGYAARISQALGAAREQAQAAVIRIGESQENPVGAADKDKVKEYLRETRKFLNQSNDLLEILQIGIDPEASESLARLKAAVNNPRPVIAEKAAEGDCGVGEAKFAPLPQDDLPVVPPSHFVEADMNRLTFAICPADEWQAALAKKRPDSRFYDISLIGHEYENYNWKLGAIDHILTATLKQPEAE